MKENQWTKAAENNKKKKHQKRETNRRAENKNLLASGWIDLKIFTNLQHSSITEWHYFSFRHRFFSSFSCVCPDDFLQFFPHSLPLSPTLFVVCSAIFQCMRFFFADCWTHNRFMSHKLAAFVLGPAAIAASWTILSRSHVKRKSNSYTYYGERIHKLAHTRRRQMLWHRLVATTPGTPAIFRTIPLRHKIHTHTACRCRGRQQTGKHRQWRKNTNSF